MSTVERNYGNNGSGPGPVFVVGMWRSGTSLFYALLNQHPEIALLYEGDIPLLWPLFLGPKAKSDWPERWEFWNSGVTRHKLDINRLARNVTTVREACESAWEQYSTGAIRGCKSPNYFDMLPSLAKQFPNARFLVIWRNPMDICRSVVRASKRDSFFAKSGMVLRALRGYHELKLGYDWLVANGIPVHAIQYENLVSNPVDVMSELCGFLNIEFDPRMATLEAADRSAIYDAEHHEGVKSQRIGPRKPKSEVLPADVQAKIERYIAFWHKEYGGKWPAEPVVSSGSAPAWFAVERFFDGALYRSLRIFDWAVVFIYCFAPLWLLGKYRSLRGRTGETSPAQKAAASETTLKQPLAPSSYERMQPLENHPAMLDENDTMAHTSGTTVSR